MLKAVQKNSKRLRKEREWSFYGAEDFIPTEEYSLEDAELATRDAELVLKTVETSFESM